MVRVLPYMSDSRDRWELPAELWHHVCWSGGKARTPGLSCVKANRSEHRSEASTLAKAALGLGYRSRGRHQNVHAVCIELTTMRPPFGDRPATGHFTGLLWQWLSINSVHRQIARA